MIQIIADHNIFVTETGFNDLVVNMFSDYNKIMASKKSGIIIHIKAKLAAIFFIIDMAPISFYLGLKIKHNRENQMIKLLQLAYIDKIFFKFYFYQAHIVNTSVKKIILL